MVAIKKNMSLEGYINQKYGAGLCEVLLVDDEDFNDLTHEFEYGEDDDEDDRLWL